MSSFGRKFDIDSVMRTPPAWWRDLLSLWCPSGIEAGEHGLRLAIRNGYINFYRRGQSVARVDVKAGKPVLSVHWKYVAPEGGPALPKGQEYMTMTTNVLAHRGTELKFTYEGFETLKLWIARIDKDYGGHEKCLVDKLLDHPGNDGVIDLEMGLPAWGGKNTAPRMDLVSINRVGGELTVFFGEVKRVTDSRLRCRADVEADVRPEVLKQLSDYRKFLEVPEHSQQMGKQYAQCAKLLKGLRNLADDIGPSRLLGQTILDAADHEELKVSGRATLIVMNKVAANQAAWAIHRKKLEEQREFVPMIVLDSATAIRFGEPA